MTNEVVERMRQARGVMAEAHKVIGDLRVQRDALLAASEAALRRMNMIPCTNGSDTQRIISELREAIRLAKGE